MKRKQALAELIAKVEAGNATNDGAMFRAFGDSWIICFDAFHGSLDAAKALHDAVLPKATFKMQRGRDAFGVSVGHMPVCLANCPARAWLLAILHALHSMDPDA